MKSFPRIAAAVLLCYSLSHAQPRAGREELRSVPREDAVVLDPVGPWQRSTGSRDPWLVSMDQESGHPKMTVLEPGKQGRWFRTLGIPINLRRYPILILRYRATGILPSNKPILQLVRTKRGYIPAVQNRDVIADGEEHELVV
ncbi:MAG: hypothetical protein HN849_21875, partial [Victivallales bacterium]|nr:hypothetical protein [Victivallales bacterium]